MTIDDFVSVLVAGTRLGVITFDEATVRAPHHDVVAFDAAALAADAARLRAVVTRLGTGAVRSVGGTLGDDWLGSGGRAADAVAQTTTGRVAAAVADLGMCADELASAVTTIDDVLIRYRRVMTIVSDPAVVVPGTASSDDVRTELIARMEYANAAGRVASAALVDIAALTASSGELVLAGDR
ncbi:hypothetical protein [Gordonia sp. MMO-8]|uniref:hypothetical protein n=1 Tax=Gordonia sp. MMO-8 TaxID=3127886 RepID=UPI0030187BDB